MAQMSAKQVGMEIIVIALQLIIMVVIPDITTFSRIKQLQGGIEMVKTFVSNAVPFHMEDGFHALHYHHCN